MGLAHSLRYIKKHPLGGWPGLGRFVRWQFGTRILGNHLVVMPWIDGTYLALNRGMQGASGNLYCGLHEYRDMAFVMDLISPGDLFVDIGANVGTYTVIASGVCGAHTVAFEPVELAYQRLQRNVRINDLGGLVEAINSGVSDRDGVIEFTVNSDTTNRVVNANERRTGLNKAETNELPVVRLDTALAGREPTLMKIDVEGWELPVLAGATKVLVGEKLLACIIEVNDSALEYGFDPKSILLTLREHGFEPFDYDPASQRLQDWKGGDGTNVLFVRDATQVRQRLESAPNRRVLGESLRPSDVV